jgi:hypothetical protein
VWKDKYRYLGVTKEKSMPASLKLHSRPSSAPRVRRWRARKKIAELRKHETWLLWALQQFYEERNIPISAWVRASDLYESPVTDRDIQIKVVMPDDRDFFRDLDNPAIALATVRQGPDVVLLIRPRYLRNEVAL